MCNFLLEKPTVSPKMHRLKAGRFVTLCYSPIALPPCWLIKNLISQYSDVMNTFIYFKGVGVMCDSHVVDVRDLWICSSGCPSRILA